LGQKNNPPNELPRGSLEVFGTAVGVDGDVVHVARGAGEDILTSFLPAVVEGETVGFKDVV